MKPHDRTPHLIWIAQKYPLGTPDGARHATCVLIRHLVQEGADIQLICIAAKGDPRDAEELRRSLGVTHCLFIERPNSSWRPKIGFRIPWTFRAFATPHVNRALLSALRTCLSRDQGPAAIIFDGLHASAALSGSDMEYLAQRCAVVYRAHNFETALWEQSYMKEKMPWLRWIYRRQTKLVRAVELRTAVHASFVAPVSTEDAARFKGLSPRITTHVTPIGIEFPPEHLLQPVDQAHSALRLLFVGRLDWLPNRKGLEWFLDHVWHPVLRQRPDIELTVAGVGNGKWLEPYRSWPNLTILGAIKDLEPLYQACSMTIAPLFQGSGTRVKILEAARYARAAVSTALGTEGTGLVPGLSFVQAESEEEWIRMLGSLSVADCHRFGLKAYQDLRERFDARRIAQRFLSHTMQRSGVPLRHDPHVVYAS